MSQYLQTTGASGFVGRFTLGGDFVAVLLPVSVMLMEELNLRMDSGLVFSLFLMSLNETYFELSALLSPVRIIDSAGFSSTGKLFTFVKLLLGICSMLHSRLAIWAIGQDGLNPTFRVAFDMVGGLRAMVKDKGPGRFGFTAFLRVISGRDNFLDCCKAFEIESCSFFFLLSNISSYINASSTNASE